MEICYEPLGDFTPKYEEVFDWSMLNFSTQLNARGIFDQDLETVDDYIQYYSRETEYDDYLICALAEFDTKRDT